MSFVCDPKNAIKKKKLAQTFAIDMPANSQASTEKLSNKMKRRQQRVADWVCLHLFIFGSIMLNFLYTSFLQDFMVSARCLTKTLSGLISPISDQDT